MSENRFIDAEISKSDTLLAVLALIGTTLSSVGAGSFVDACPMSSARWGHTATLLPNGKVLVAGGYVGVSDLTLASAELYDPASGTWANLGALTTRVYHTATLLPNGKVLFVGGLNQAGHSLSMADLYDSALGTWIDDRGPEDRPQ